MAKYDVIVVGGGAVGLTAALTLAVKSSGGLRVGLLDAAQTRKPSRLRTSALAEGPWTLLRSLAGDSLDRLKTTIRTMEISTDRWRPPAPPDLVFATGASLAAVVSHADLEPALSSAAQAAGVEFIFGEVVGYEANNMRADLHLADGASFQTSLIVAADGHGSRLRAAARIPTVERDYRRSALVATLRHEELHEGVAVQIFYQQGPFALLPIEDQKTSMVWVETTEDARDLHSLKPEQLRPLIEEKSRHRFGSVIAVEEGPHLFPLKSSHARFFASDRLLLAGDALRRIHPLAGQGLNLGLRDAAALARCVLDHARLGLDPGALEVSKEYAQLRQADSIFSSIFLDLFFDVFDIDGPGATLVRSAALRAADQLPILKNYLTSEAGGLRGAHSFF